jgi:hypothetical protein
MLHMLGFVWCSCCYVVWFLLFGIRGIYFHCFGVRKCVIAAFNVEVGGMSHCALEGIP